MPSMRPRRPLGETSCPGIASRERPRCVWIAGRWWTPLPFRHLPREADVPAWPPPGPAEPGVYPLVRLRPLSGPESLRRVREERAHVEAERGALGSPADPRGAQLGQEAEGLRRLEEELVGRNTGLWEVLPGISTTGGSPTVTEERAREQAERRTPAGYRPLSVAYRALPLLRAWRPGTPTMDLPWHLLTDSSAAPFLPLWEDHLQDPGGLLVGVHAIQGTPLVWDRFARPSHSSAIFGMTGSGKSYASALGWLRSSLFVPDLSLFILDPLGGLSEVVRRLGGEVVPLARRGLAVNPLDPRTCGGDRSAKASRVGVMLRALFPSLHDEERAILDVVVSSLYAREKDRAPRLGELLAALGADPRTPPRLPTLLEPLVRGSLAHLDTDTTLDLGARMVGFDLRGVPAELLPFHMVFLLDLVAGELRRREGPKLVVLDEAHYLARDPSTAAFLDHLVRHVRHHRAGLELLTQNPEDFLGSHWGRSVLLNLESCLLLRLRDGGERLAPLLGLSPGERDFLRKAPLPAEAGYAGGILRAGDRHFPLAVVSSDAEHELLSEAFRSETGPPGTTHRELKREARVREPHGDQRSQPR